MSESSNKSLTNSKFLFAFLSLYTSIMALISPATDFVSPLFVLIQRLSKKTIVRII